MIGVRTLMLLSLVSLVLTMQDMNIQCPEQNENSTAVTIANPANCSTFYECDNGLLRLLDCPADTFFSSKDHVCTFRKDSDCPDSKIFSEDVFSFTMDGGDESTDVSTSFNCPDEQDNETSTYFPNFKNCSTFYECSNGKFVLLECPEKLYFNVEMRVCTLPSKSQCTQPGDSGVISYSKSDAGADYSGFVAFEDDVSGLLSDTDWLEEMRVNLDNV